MEPSPISPERPFIKKDFVGQGKEHPIRQSRAAYAHAVPCLDARRMVLLPSLSYQVACKAQFACELLYKMTLQQSRQLRCKCDHNVIGFDTQEYKLFRLDNRMPLASSTLKDYERCYDDQFTIARLRNSMVS